MNFTYQIDLKLGKSGHKLRCQKDESDFIVAHKYAATDRTHKYIPKEFRDKHILPDKAKETGRKS